MQKLRFDKAFVKFIHSDVDKIKPSTFFQIIKEIERERVDRTIELRAKVMQGNLYFEPSPEICVHENVIIIDNLKIVVKLS